VRPTGRAGQPRENYRKFPTFGGGEEPSPVFLKSGEIPDARKRPCKPYRFYPLESGNGGTGALKRQVPAGSITEECSRVNPGGWGLFTESLLYGNRPPCIATKVSSPKGQGRIQFRRGTTADPDPVEYLYTVNYFNLLERTNIIIIKRETLTNRKRNLDIGDKNTQS
jgi:hypothetical protein